MCVANPVTCIMYSGKYDLIPCFSATGYSESCRVSDAVRANTNADAKGRGIAHEVVGKGSNTSSPK